MEHYQNMEKKKGLRGILSEINNYYTKTVTMKFL